MLRYETLRRRPGAVKALTGLSDGEFEALYERFVPAWEEAERERLSRPDRRRAIGAGHPYQQGPATRVLMTTMWVRLYLTTATLGALFGVDKATVSRNGRWNGFPAGWGWWPMPVSTGCTTTYRSTA